MLCKALPEESEQSVKRSRVGDLDLSGFVSFGAEQ